MNLNNKPKASGTSNGKVFYEFQVSLASLGTGKGQVIGVLFDDSGGGMGTDDRWYPRASGDAPWRNDEFQIYNRALSAPEIQDYYNATQ